MKLFDFRKNKDMSAGIALHLTHMEALQLIQSLTNQMVAGNTVSGRHENTIQIETSDGKKESCYFTAFVTPLKNEE